MNVYKASKNISMSVKLYTASIRKNLYLTISVAISMLLFLIVALYMDFDYATKEKAYNKFQNNYLVISTQSDKDIQQFQNMFEGKNYFINTYTYATGGFSTESGEYVNIYYNTVISNNLVEDVYFGDNLYSYSEYEKYRIKYGRSNFIGANEVIISEEYAMFLAKNPTEAIGKRITMTIDDINDIYEVVGIFGQTLSESRENKGYLDILSSGRSNKVDRLGEPKFIHFTVFISPDSIEMRNEYYQRNYFLYLFYNSEKQKDEFSTMLDIMANRTEGNRAWSYMGDDEVESLKNNMYSSLATIKALIMVIVTIISGLNIFGTMVNSIADRKKEIGVKKALGASDGDIMFGFIVENIINVCIAIILAVAMASILFLGYGYYQRQILYNDYIFVFYPETIILFLTFAISSILGFSLIPAYKASQVNVIDTIRIE